MSRDSTSTPWPSTDTRSLNGGALNPNPRPMSNLRIGVPSKGRLAEIAEALLKEAGLHFRRPERSLFARCREMPVDITFLRTEDIPVLCSEGAIDMGITGSDLVAESSRRVDRRGSSWAWAIAGWQSACRKPAPFTTPQAIERPPHRHQLSQHHGRISAAARRRRPIWYRCRARSKS